jgi:guanylate kinase
METRKPRSLLIVLAAPSGGGKTTLCDRLLDEFPIIQYSISCTTRPPRGQEQDGIDYHFLTDEAFVQRVQAGEFLEHAMVHGHRYGTLRAPVEATLRAGGSVMMDLDVQGAAELRTAVARAAPDDLLKAGFVDIFIEPPSMAVLRERLQRRGEDSDEVVERRLRNAATEMARRHEFKYRVINEDVGTAYADMREIVMREMGLLPIMSP